MNKNNIRLLGLALSLVSGAAAADQLLFIDPVTGDFREPTAADWAQLPRSAEGKALVKSQVLPDGTILIPASAVMHEMTATIQPDGSLKTDCDHPADAE